MNPVAADIESHLVTFAADRNMKVRQHDHELAYVGWGNKRREMATVDGGTRVVLIGDVGESIAVTIEPNYYSPDRRNAHWLGYGAKTRKQGILWTAAHGYVSGFPVSAIVWYTLTRSIPSALHLQRRLRTWLMLTGSGWVEETRQAIRAQIDG